MKSSFLTKTMAAICGCALLGAGQARAFTIDFANIGAASVSFDASSDSFSFIDGDMFDFAVTSGGASADLLGNLSGTFTIGPVTSQFGLERAGVTGLGTVTIDDGTFTFSADVAWLDITTFGVFGGLNAGGILNLTNFSYAGSNVDLVALLNVGSANTTVSFQFADPTSLTDLTTGTGTRATSYSGSIATRSIPDSGSMLAMLGAGLVVTGIIRRKLKA